MTRESKNTQTQPPAEAGENRKIFLVKPVKLETILLWGNVLDSLQLDQYRVKTDNDMEIPLYDYHDNDNIIAGIRADDELYLIVQGDRGEIVLITYKITKEVEEK